jgi:hypothetical protein
MLSKMLRGSVNNTTAPPAADANFNQVSLLLHGDGTNGAQNNTFLDSSTNNFTVTRNGNTTQGTNTPFSQADGAWSNYFDNITTISRFDFPASSAFSIGTGDFTVEFWIYYIYKAGYQFPFGIGSSSNQECHVRFPDNGFGEKIQCGMQTNTTSDEWSCALTKADFNEKWMHVAFTRSSSVCRFFVNGQLQNINNGANPSTYPYTSFTDTTNITDTQFNLGASKGGTNPFPGYISNFRYIKGTALYTSSFTPSTTPLTAVTNTQVLTCQSNYFKDNSSNNFALSAVGSISVQPFSPFAPTSAYSTSVNGGSMYFDGTGDYLKISGANLAAGTSDFTWELYTYVPASGAFQTFIDSRTGTANQGLFIGLNTGTLTPIIYNESTLLFTSSISLVANTWNHVALVRNSGTIVVYINGVSGGSFSNSYTLSSTNYGIASNFNVASNYLSGYISNLRIVNGTAVYTANFTPPTAPLTAITNTSLLLSGTNAGIYDNAIKNDLETVGSAQVSTSVVKYGTGSMKFNGTTDYLTLPSTPNLAMGSGNFTWECWVYTSAGSYFQAFISSREGSGDTGLYLGTNNATLQPMVYNDSAIQISGSINITANTWTHVALVRNSGTLTLYIGGTSAGSTSTFNNLTSTFYKIGCDGKASQGLFLNGYLDDLRVTKGIARYTANFTPPTSAFPNQ